ncbi:DUF2975 domain-containing protein [Planococcus sp. CAU13]|uniref:DUF2975 domain-containing protein n=1 Tax=Planococcus sp. CAU13 TaxID=1541197 RepID=UPI00052FFF33|nr:DUF2975 domain-containing protein [Planococcus sp. CAU13]
MKRSPTAVLKFAIFLVGLPVLAGCIYGLSRFDPNSPYWALPELEKLQYPLLIGMYIGMIPFFIALYQALKLLGYVDRNQAFSALSVKAVKRIKLCAIAIIAVYIAEMPFLYLLTLADDAPGVIIGLFVIFVSLIVAVVAAVLQKLLQEAMQIKSENDLIV